MQELLSLNQAKLISLLVFMLLDIITGVIKAVIEQDLKSTIFRNGLLKKVLEVCILVVGFMIDWSFSVNYVGLGCTIALLTMEAWSIIENIQDYVPLPTVLESFLKEVNKNDIH